MAARTLGLPDIRQGRRRSRLRLLAPVRYLFIHHPEKARYDVIVPIGIGLGLSAAHFWLFPDISVLGDDGVLKYVRDFLVMSIPFLFGALAGVAMGLPGPHFDRRPPGAELLLDGEVLTLRQFVCHLLGFLTFVGVVLYLGAVAADLLKKPVLALLAGSEGLKAAIFWGGSLALWLTLAYFFITMLWALYFLTDIVNRPPRETV